MSVTRRAPVLLCALLMLVAMSGCGQKGPLYIPQQEVPAAEEPAPAE
jgi:predicted small lipoprotein YifL